MEAWQPLLPSGRSPLAWTTTGVVDAASVHASGRSLALLGVTAPADQPVLDVRAWKIGVPSPVALPVVGIPATGDPAERLFVFPSGRSSDGTWPDGSYQLDLLMGTWVERVRVRVVDAAAALLPGPLPGRPLSAAELGPFSLTAGAFWISGPGNVRAAGAGLDKVAVEPDEMRDWLDQAPNVLASPGVPGPIAIFGASAGPERWFVRATASRVLPNPAVLGQATFLAGSGSEERPRLAVFVPSDTVVGWPFGVYRIDATWRDSTGPTAVSWRLLLLPATPGSTSPLLDAGRAWSEMMPRPWSVVSQDGSSPVQTLPAGVDPIIDPVRIDGRCVGGAAVGTSAPYLGVAYPKSLSLADVTVGRVRDPYDGGSPIVVPVQRTNAISDLVLMRPMSTGTWDRGLYVVTLRTGEREYHVGVCVG